MMYLSSSSAVDLGANQARSRRLASERKSYQLTIHQEEEDNNNNNGRIGIRQYYCITETRVASGRETKLSSKWQILPSSPRQLPRTTNPTTSSLSSILRHGSSKEEETTTSQASLRFSSCVDQRFYIKDSLSRQQLVKISSGDDGSSLDDLIDSSPSSSPSSYENNDTDGIRCFIDAVNNGWAVQNIVKILQEDVDRTNEDLRVRNEEWFAELYKSIKDQVAEYSPTPLDNLTQIYKLLKIYKHSENAIKSARAMKQWSRFEVKVESISNLGQQQQQHQELDDNAAESTNNTFMVSGEMYYSSDRKPRLKLGNLPPKQISCFVDYSKTDEEAKDSDDSEAMKPSRTYCFNHNFGSLDEHPELTLHLRQGQQSLGKVVLPSSVFRLFSTHPKKTFTLDREIKCCTDDSSTTVAKGATVKFTIRKDELKSGFLDEKRCTIASEISQVIGWIRKFNKINNSPSTRSPPLLSAHICAQDNVSLLHAAIYCQNVPLVQTLMSMGANPNCGSSIGSAMTLAYNHSDRFKVTDKKPYEQMIQLMQRQGIDEDKKYRNDGLGNSGSNPEAEKENVQHSSKSFSRGYGNKKDRKLSSQNKLEKKNSGKNPLMVRQVDYQHNQAGSVYRYSY